MPFDFQYADLLIIGLLVLLEGLLSADNALVLAPLGDDGCWADAGFRAARAIHLDAARGSVARVCASGGP